MTEIQTSGVQDDPLMTIGIGAPVEECWQECWMDFDGARMRYLRAGSGPALILLHGLLGYAFSWRYAIPALAPHFTVFAPDMLGAGFSDRPRDIDHSMRGTARRVLQFADRLGLASFDLLGTSRGGAVAMCAAAMCAEGICAPAEGSDPSRRVRPGRLILVAPVNPYSPHGTWLAPFAGTPLGSAMVRFIVGTMPGFYPYWHGRMFGDRGKIPPGSLEGYKAPLAQPGLFDHALSIVGTWTADLRELEALLPTLRPVPTFLMWGSKDPAVYVSSMEPLARNFAHVQKVVFPGVGHLPYEECPQEFNQALLGFLATSR
jgi:pimeloyl-ACP methyl ester carboxylesterase